MPENQDSFNRIRRPTTPAQQIPTRTTSSFTGIKEEIPSIRLDNDFAEEAKPGFELELEVTRLERRMKKLEMLLEVYDIPLPPWRER